MRSGRLWRIGLVYGLVAALAAFCLHLVSLTPLWLDWGRELVAAVIALAGVVVGLRLRERQRDRTAAPTDLLPPAVPAAPKNPAAAAAASSAPAPTDAPPLTRSELAILRLLAQGHSNKALARALNVSENTVKTHLANLYAKLGVGRRVDAVLAAQRLGLVGLPGMPAAWSSDSPVESPVTPPNFTRPGDGSTG
jgi:DNA-binding CsgD family transcriptional regulator